MELAGKVATQLHEKVLCPVCSDDISQQPLVLYADDIVPEQDILFCPHCELELYLTVIEKGKR